MDDDSGILRKLCNNINLNRKFKNIRLNSKKHYFAIVLSYKYEF